MAKRRLMLQHRQKGTGGGLLSFAVVLITVLACALISPPQPLDVASVFAHGAATPAANDAAIRLPEMNWFLVISNSHAVAACGTLLEAEIIRDTYGELAGVQLVETNEIAMRVTASQAQLTALRQGADAIIESLNALGQMTRLSMTDAASLAGASYRSLSNLYGDMETSLSGTQNPVARGLMGLVASCREVMSNLLVDASSAYIQAQYAGLVQQYEAYTVFLASAV